jgi:hypothetical protein
MASDQGFIVVNPLTLTGNMAPDTKDSASPSASFEMEPGNIAARGRLRQMLDQCYELSNLAGLKEEGIRVPAIVVVGEQSQGKSTVLSRILKINLPTKSGICTRIPLLIELRDKKGYDSGEAEQSISFKWPGSREYLNINEEEIPGLVNKATIELAGPGSSIDSKAATLTVLRKGAPGRPLF